MTGKERRQQLLDVARELFAEKGFDAASIEEIAHRAAVSKPVVYEHFGGKEGVYAVVVDREMQTLLENIVSALSAGNAELGAEADNASGPSAPVEASEYPRELLEQAACALLDYIENSTDGFRILVRDSPVASATGTFSSLLNDIASQVEHILALQFSARGYDAKFAPLYSQALVGMVALTGQWWLEVRKPKKEDVAAHLVNLCWNGLSHLDEKPSLRTK